MKTINITFSEDNIEDLKDALFTFETECLRDGYKALYKAISKLRKYIEQQSEINN